MKLIGFLIINSIALLLTAYLVPGFVLETYTAAGVAAVVIGVINTFIKPIVKIITLPITFLTLGLFALVLNIVFLYAASYITPGFTIETVFAAVIGSIVLSLISSFLGMLAK